MGAGAYDGDSGYIKGGTDDTLVGNVTDSLKTNVTASALPTGAATSANQTNNAQTTQIVNSSGDAVAVKAASTAPLATDKAAVVALSPNGNHATAANQTTEITALQLIDNAVGPVSPGTQATNSFLTGAVYNSTPPTLTNTQQASLQLTSVGALIVDQSASLGVPYINRTDVSSTVSATGNSSTLETAGFMSLSARVAVTAISGTNATIQISLQQSDDGTNWISSYDTLRITATTSEVWSSIRIAHRYYRYSWIVSGTTPSVTIAIVSTLKAVQPLVTTRRAFYSDVSLTVVGNRSTPFYAPGARNITVAFQRGADGGNNGTVQLYASIDATNYFSISGNLAANVSTSNDTTVGNASWLYYAIQVTANTNAGTRVLDIQWSGN